MQRKISVIIATDFLCWIPFVVVCSLHTLSVVDATPWYALFSIVILPINSVINPLLYDATITDTVKKYFSLAIAIIQRRLTQIRARLGLGENESRNRIVNNAVGSVHTSMSAIRSFFTSNIEEDTTHELETNIPNDTPDIEEIELEVLPDNRTYVEDGEQPCCSKTLVEKEESPCTIPYVPYTLC